MLLYYNHVHLNKRRLYTIMWIFDYVTGIRRSEVSVPLRGTDRSRIACQVALPAYVGPHTPKGVLPCIVVIQTASMATSDMDRYVQDGIVVCTYQIQACTRVQDMFQESAGDAQSVYRYLTTQFPCIDPNRVFLLGRSYAAGVVARCLIGTDVGFAGGILLSPILYISALRETPPWTRVSDTHLDSIRVPIYMHLDITDRRVDPIGAIQMFDRRDAAEDPFSCLRCVLGPQDPFADVIQWVRSVGLDPIQRRRTEIAGPVSTYSTLSHHPDQYKVSEGTTRVPQTASMIDQVLFPGCLRRVIHRTLSTMAPIRSLLYLHTPILWEKRCVHSLNITGAPIVCMTVGPRVSTSCPVTLVLMEYNRLGYGWPLSSKRLYFDQMQESVVHVRMPMVSTHVHGGSTLALILTNRGARLPHITFRSVRLPYLFEW